MNQVSPPGTRWSMSSFVTKTWCIINFTMPIKESILHFFTEMRKLIAECSHHSRTDWCPWQQVVKMQSLSNSANNIHILRCSFHQSIRGVIKSNYWCKSNIKIKLWLKVIRFQRSPNEHLWCALWMSDVCTQLFQSGCFKDKINLGWLIIDAHFFEVEFPKLFLLGSVFNVFMRIEIASVIAHPNVKTCFGESECWSKFWWINDPLNWTILNSMLEENSWRTLFPNDSVHCKDISILSGNLMGLKLEPIFFNDLLYVMFSIINVRNQLNFFPLKLLHGRSNQLTVTKWYKDK